VLRSEVIFKVIVVGNADVGKSALIRRFVFDSFTPLKSTAPVGVDHKVSEPCRGRFWCPFLNAKAFV
jgi:GTPase SAR1 family protein